MSQKQKRQREPEIEASGEQEPVTAAQPSRHLNRERQTAGVTIQFPASQLRDFNNRSPKITLNFLKRLKRDVGGFLFPYGKGED